jgi:hypothetical protein
MDAKCKRLIQIMVFYAVLACVIAPIIGWKLGKDQTDSIEKSGHAFVIGSIISILLWYNYGINEVKKAQ